MPDQFKTLQAPELAWVWKNEARTKSSWALLLDTLAKKLLDGKHLREELAQKSASIVKSPESTWLW